MSVLPLSQRNSQKAAPSPEPVTTEVRRTRRGPLAALVRRPQSVVALTWLFVVVGATVLRSALLTYGPTEQDLSQVLAWPSADHLLGTDSLGRDLLARLLFGAPVSLLGTLLATVTAITLGSLFGIVAGYARGVLDTVQSAVADVLMSIPVLVILLSVAAVTSNNLIVMMIVLGVLMSASVYRVFRGATLELREELYVTAARTSGLSHPAIIARHLIPRLVGVLIVQAAIVASLALVVQVGLGFLSIDATPPDPSWGNLVKDASATIYSSVWPLVPPAAVIALTVLAFSTIGDVAQQAVTGRAQHPGLRARSRIRVRRDSRAHARTSVAATESSSSATAGEADEVLLAVRDLCIAIPNTTRTHGRGGDQSELTTLVDRVSIDLRRGEVVGLVGESGAGKSVTARAVLGLFPTDAVVSGSIRYGGQEVLAAPRDAVARLRGREIAFISQEPMASLNPVIRIGHQVEEAVRTHRDVTRSQAREIALTLLADVKIPDPSSVSRLYPHQVSGGMAQRVIIAIALAGEPQVIVADEPTTALDVSVQMQILQLLRELQRTRHLAVLVVTHDWGVVADLCDRAVTMYAGEVVEEASVVAAFETPYHPYSAALRLADPHSQAPGQRLTTIPGQVPPPGSWPVGCRFADRCVHATSECTAAPVEIERIEPGRLVRCVRTQELGALTHD